MKINGIFHFLQFNHERNKLNLNLPENSARCVSNPTGGRQAHAMIELAKLLNYYSYSHIELIIFSSFIITGLEN